MERLQQKIVTAHNIVIIRDFLPIPRFIEIKINTILSDKEVAAKITRQTINRKVRIYRVLPFNGNNYELPITEETYTYIYSY